MESNANGVTEGDKPASLGMAAMDLSWLFCSAEEQLLITIKCGEDGDEKTFTFLKPIQTKHSKFFEKCLRNPCKESASSTIERPEVELDDFSAATALESHVKFYQLCDFLQNDALAKGVRDMLVRYVKNRDRVHGEDDAPTIFRVYAGAFDLLEPGHVGQAKLRRILVKTFCRLAVGKQYALNAMWNDPFLRSAAEGIKTQRMLIDDESETEQ
ncbi:hypothetical protein COL922a_012725 [Colletotrichum nupharicola]|nr:hypothetical protein COL922a_012725 [Colletotrichum nupharicola]